MKKLNIGLQLFTLRDETAADFRGTLRKVAELGYEGVEFAGYGDIPAEEMKALLDELGLKVLAATFHCMPCVKICNNKSITSKRLGLNI